MYWDFHLVFYQNVYKLKSLQKNQPNGWPSEISIQSQIMISEIGRSVVKYFTKALFFTYPKLKLFR